MPVQLRNPREGFPRDGFRLSDPHTAKLFEDPYSDMNTLVKQVIEHRRGNPNIYPESNAAAFDSKAVELEILIQFCADKPQYCEDSARPGQPYPPVPDPAAVRATVVSQPEGKKCLKCGGSDFEPVICMSCGGRRTGYKCIKCGLEI